MIDKRGKITHSNFSKNPTVKAENMTLASDGKRNSQAFTPRLTNITYDALAIGQSASLSRTLTLEDIMAFAMVTHDYNPAHLDEEYAKDTMFKGVIAHGMWAAGLISAVLGTKLPGTGTIYLSQNLSFRRPVQLDDTLTATVTVTQKDDIKKWVTLDCQVVNQAGKTVVTGDAQVVAPTQSVSRDVVALAAMTLMQQFSG